MDKPTLSPSFTVDDIHKLREYNYRLTKDMTPQERMDFYNNAGRAFQEEIERGRQAKRQE